VINKGRERQNEKCKLKIAEGKYQIAKGLGDGTRIPAEAGMT
jgi:hypothetical protein